MLRGFRSRGLQEFHKNQAGDFVSLVFVLSHFQGGIRYCNNRSPIVSCLNLKPVSAYIR